MRPNPVWECVFGWLTDAEDREPLLGDAAEEFSRRVHRDGLSPARRWYRRQVLRSIPPALRRAIARRRPRVETNPEGEVLVMWGKDFSLAVRALAKRPGFTATIVATLAFGVGATTALFGVFKAVFLEPLDLPDSGELVVVMQTASFGCCGPASGPDYVDWIERQRSFDGMGLLGPGNFNLTGLDQAERVYATSVTANSFDFLGVSPLLGRALLPEDQAVGGVVVLSHELWTRHFDGRRDVLGETLEIDGAPHDIVGVMPEGFDVPSPWGVTRSHDFFVPFLDTRMEGNRGNHSFPVFARLSDGVDLEAAQADMDRIMAELAEEYPESNGARGARVFSAHDFRYGNTGRQFGMLLAAAALVLLIACGNVASLQLARAAGRETELAVRSAMGASRRTIVRLLFSESLLLSLLGGAGGVLVAMVAVERLRRLMPASVPRVDQIGVDGSVLGFALGASIVTALLFGMLPAIFASRTDLASGVREGGYGTFAPAKERLRDAFIVGQIALGLLLANGAGLLVQSYSAVRGQDYGFQAEGALTLALSAGGSEYETAQARQMFYEEVLRKVEEVPSVSAVGFVSKLPLEGGSNGNVQVADAPPRANRNEGPLVEVSSVAGDYFEAMGIPVVLGRTLQADDSIPGAVGVMINQAMADEFWPGQNPLGKQFGFDVDPPWLTVVGVVGTVRQWGVEQRALPETYFPFSRGWASEGYVVARVAGEPEAVVQGVREAIRGVDPRQPPSDIMAMSERLSRAFAERRFNTTLVGLFAVAALLLASAGIYGTVSYFVSRRIRELGIRMALGAGGGGIMRLVVRRGVRLAIWGLGIGLLGVWASTSAVEAMVYGVGAIDLATLAAGCAVLGGIAVVASALPALRATRVPPVIALRAE